MINGVSPRCNAGGAVESHFALRSALRKIRPVDLLFVALPCFLFLSLGAVCFLANFDVRLSSCFFCERSGGWPLAKVEPFSTMYHSGCLPSLLVGVLGLVVAISSRFLPSLRKFRRTGLVLALTLALGPGVLVNGILKPCVARPRPNETVPFGGERQFAYIGPSKAGMNSRSFPSGHASMGFFLMTPALLFYRRRPRLALAILVVGGSYGALMGVARIAQGAHFATDVLAAAACVYFSGVVAVALIRLLEGLRKNLGARDGAPQPVPLPLPES